MLGSIDEKVEIRLIKFLKGQGRSQEISSEPLFAG